MSEQVKDGGPAFPGQWDHGGSQVESWTGMTLRDYFAAKAMQGMMSDPTVNPSTDADYTQLAGSSYRVADFMLAAREKK